MILDVASPSVFDKDGGLNIILVIIGILVLICLVGIIIYLKNKGGKNEKN